MARIVYAMLVSLDGYIAGPEGGAALPVPGDALHRYFNGVIRDASASLYGRRMYEVMRAWETADREAELPEAEVEYAPLWRAMPKIVVSTTLREVGPNARLVTGDLGAAVGELRARVGGDVLVAGAGLAGSLSRLGLIDEYQLFMQPVVLGGGKPFFEAGNPLELETLGTQSLPEGVVLLRYAPSGRNA